MVRDRDIVRSGITQKNWTGVYMDKSSTGPSVRAFEALGFMMYSIEYIF